MMMVYAGTMDTIFVQQPDFRLVQMTRLLEDYFTLPIH